MKLGNICVEEAGVVGWMWGWYDKDTLYDCIKFQILEKIGNKLIFSNNSIQDLYLQHI